MKNTFLSVSLVVLGIISSGCATKPNYLRLEDFKAEVTEYILSGNYEKDIAKVFEENRAEVESLIEKNKGKKLVAVFDVDETSLSMRNYEMRAEYGFILDLWNWSVKQADAPAIQATFDFYKWLQSKGVTCVFYTGRDRTGNKTTDPTIRNLKRVGFTGYENIYFKNDWLKTHTSKYDPNSSKVMDYKSSIRCDYEKKGYTILTSVGDQWNDHTGNCGALVKIKLENPMYQLPKPMHEVIKKYNYDPGKFPSK